MQRTLREHITYLEQKIEALKEELRDLRKPTAEQNEVAVDLGMAERALVHFRKAFYLELKLKERSPR
jgi:hypothetical protein